MLLKKIEEEALVLFDKAVNFCYSLLKQVIVLFF